jgi:O-antigen/teichoic acid export membrane protein
LNNVKKNILANYLGKICTGGLNVILLPVYIKYLGVEAYGLVGFFASLTSILAIFDLGIGATLNREIAKYSVTENKKIQRNLLRTFELIYWGIAIFSFIIVFFSSAFLSEKWLNNSSISHESAKFSIQLMAVSIALNFPIALYQGGLMGLEKQVLLNKLQTLLALFRHIGAVLVLIYLRSTIEVFFIWQVFTSIISVVIFYLSIWNLMPRKFGGGEFDLEILKNIWKYSMAVSISAIIGIVMSQLDKVILSKTLTLESFGYYNIAYSLASSVWLIITPFNSAIFPRLVQLFESKNKIKLKTDFHKYSQLLSLLLFPVSSILIFYSFEILVIWTNNNLIAEKTCLLVSVLVIGIMLNGMASLPINSANASGKPMLITYTNIFQSILIIPLIFVLIYFFQSLGAAIATVIMNSTYLLFTVPYFFKKLIILESKKWYLQDIILPLFISFLITYIMKLGMPNFESIYSKLSWLFLTFLLTSIFQIITSIKMKNQLSFDISKFYKNITRL